jgi:hypothetical protein
MIFDAFSSEAANINFVALSAEKGPAKRYTGKTG